MTHDALAHLRNGRHLQRWFGLATPLRFCVICLLAGCSDREQLLRTQAFGQLRALIIWTERYAEEHGRQPPNLAEAAADVQFDVAPYYYNIDGKRNWIVAVKDPTDPTRILAMGKSRDRIVFDETIFIEQMHPQKN